MKKSTFNRLGLALLCLSPILILFAFKQYQELKTTRTNAAKQNPKEVATVVDGSTVEKGLAYLASAQFENGGWGAGQNSAQHIKNAHAVSIDPATTAFSTMALIRSGNSFKKGKYKENVKKGVQYLIELVKNSPEDSPMLTNIRGTQPQAKLGSNIDASMVLQLFNRANLLTDLDNKTKNDLKTVTQKCINKIQAQQAANGQINGAGWAGVLQSAMADKAIEEVQNLPSAADYEIDESSFKGLRESQVKIVSGSSISTESAAGIELYAASSNQRATAKDAKKIRREMKKAKEQGKLDEDAPVNVDNLQAIGYSKDEAERYDDNYRANEVSLKSLNDDKVLSGFGNNGGEEFLSYMMTSESLIIQGGNEWAKWSNKMNGQMSKIQNGNGSWSGHHCITSPVFCTAAVILTLTTENDKAILVKDEE